MASAASTPAWPAFYPPPADPGKAMPLLPAVSPSPRASGNRECIWEGVEKIIAVGDLHGDYEHFLTILQHEKIGLIDNKLRWIGGKTHLVQIGDIMDRGDDAKDIFDLIKRLEKEAVKAGGKVHMLIGNHEEMNITGIAFQYADYVTVKQFKDFLPDSYKKGKDREFKKKTEDGGDIEDEWKKLLEDNEEKESKESYTEFFNTYYGKWIAEEHNAVIKINDTIFVHGGIGEKYSTWPLKDINNLYYTEFQKVFRRESFRPKILIAEDSPLWFRQLAQWNPEVVWQPQVDKILTNLGAKQIVIAHTPIIAENMVSRFSEKVWVIDTGISRLYRGFLSALIIKNGIFERWRLNY
jgi:hypothetical protein